MARRELWWGEHIKLNDITHNMSMVRTWHMATLAHRVDVGEEAPADAFMVVGKGAAQAKVEAGL